MRPKLPAQGGKNPVVPVALARVTPESCFDRPDGMRLLANENQVLGDSIGIARVPLGDFSHLPCEKQRVVQSLASLPAHGQSPRRKVVFQETPRNQRKGALVGSIGDDTFPVRNGSLQIARFGLDVRQPETDRPVLRSLPKMGLKKASGFDAAPGADEDRFNTQKNVCAVGIPFQKLPVKPQCAPQVA